MRKLLALIFLVFWGYIPFIAYGREVKKQVPNIIFILADDLGWSDLPVYGNTFNEAPNIDKLANQGMRFTNAYAACPVCSPTRASIMSGQYPARVGIIAHIFGHWRPYEKVITPKNKTQYLPVEIQTIGEVMREAGYITGYFGKWHLGSSIDHLPGNQGFDEWNIYNGGGYNTPKFFPELNPSREGRLSDVLTDLSVDFIESNKKKSFFLFLSHYDVHVQLDADRDIINKYLKKKKFNGYPGNAVYAAMIEHVDNSVGRIMNKLKETRLERNTLIIFYSDNGGLITRYDKKPLIAATSLDFYKDSPLKYIATSNAPLRAEKGTLYEGGIREPLIMKWPGKITPGSVSDAIVSSVDFYPTLLELSGTKSPVNQILDGKSLLPVLLKNRYDKERAVFWHYPVFHHDVPSAAIRKGDWKLIENQIAKSYCLYNLKVDISESTDLSVLYPEKLNELKILLKNWQQEVNAEFPVQNPEYDESRRFEWGIHPDRK